MPARVAATLAGDGASLASVARYRAAFDELTASTPEAWLAFLDPDVVRGLAYYTGLVFEVIAEGERAVAGGGRYDELVKLFGGPATPAVGFAMGDVVLANLLDDTGLMPTDDELPGAVESALRAQAVRPEVFRRPRGRGRVRPP